MKRKMTCFVLMVIMCLQMCVTTYANQTTEEDVENNLVIDFFSEEFPNAYIILNDRVSETMPANVINTEIIASATVFVKEKYDIIDGELVITESRLLSQEEVEIEGINSFHPLTRSSFDGEAKGTLTIYVTMDQTADDPYALSNTVTLNGTADWSGIDLIYSMYNNPAVGEDYIGYAWSGGYTVNTSSCTATNSFGQNVNIYQSDGSPNSAATWSFDEMQIIEVNQYVNHINCNVTLYKGSLENGENTSEAIFKYIHTYSRNTGSLSISATPQSIGAGFSLTNSDASWSIYARCTGMFS